MMRYDSAEPAEVVDRLLDRDAQQMIRRHAEPDPDHRCRWCGFEWPCPARQLAERAAAAARQPAPRPWDTAPRRTGATGQNGVTGWQAGYGYRNNSGAFE